MIRQHQSLSGLSLCACWMFWRALFLFVLPCCAMAASVNFPFIQPQFETIGDSESIPENIITALAQDARGFMWIGTQKGLIRYDGYRFRRFTHTPSDPNSLAGDFIYSLLATPDGKIWAGSNGDGVSVFDPAKEHFERFQHDPEQVGSLGPGRILAMCNDARGGMWIATGEGLSYLPPGSKTFTRFQHDANNPRSLLNDQVRSLLRDRQGRLWIGSDSGLQRLAADGKHFETIASDRQDPASLGGKGVWALFEAQDGKLWLGTRNHGAAWLEPKTQTLHWLPLDPTRADALSHGWIDSIAQVQADQIWLASFGGGINIVAASDGRVLQQILHDPALPDSLAYDQVKPLLLDRSGLLWVGTPGGGLQRVNTRNLIGRMLRHSPIRPQSLSDNNVRSILELANGQILFGSDGNGIDIFERIPGRVGSYRARPSNPAQADMSEREREFAGNQRPRTKDIAIDGPPPIGLAAAPPPATLSPESAASLPDPNIMALAQTADGTLWAGTQQNGVIRRRPQSNTWESIAGTPSQQIRRFFIARNGHLWVGTSRGVARLNPAQDRFETINDSSAKSIKSFVNAFAEDAQGRIWVGGSNGLRVWEEGKNWQEIHSQANQADSLISNTISGLLYDRRGRLWVATDKGLERLKSLDGNHAHFEHISAKLGYPGKSMGDNLLEDRAGRIWSGEVVLEMNGSDDKIHMIVLSKVDGIDIGRNWPGSFAQTRDGLILFGGPTGVVIIDPSLLRSWNYAPPVVATELKINGQTVPLGELAQVPDLPNPTAPTIVPTIVPTLPATLALTPEQNHFTLEFAALDFSDPKRNRYQYRLQGYNKTWITVDSEHRSASYGNLWPGEYTLQVRGSNRMGDWSQNDLTITIRVLPAWYQTWWFLVLASVILTSLVYGTYRWRTTRLKALVASRTADILKLGKIGQELTSTLDTEQAFERVYKQVSARLDVSAFGIGIYNKEAEQICFGYAIEDTVRQSAITLSMSERERPAVWCVREQRELITANNAELLNYVNILLPPNFGITMESVVYLPLLIEQRVIGCLTVQSRQKNAYDKNQLEFLRVLASYTAIALSNSLVHGELAQAHGDLAQAHTDLASSHRLLQETQQQLMLQEKMAGLGTLTAGVAHEINNPTNFTHVAAQIQRTDIAEFRQFVANLIEDDTGPEILTAFSQRFEKLDGNISIMLNGTERIKGIVKDLRAFTRLDEAEKKSVRLSACLTSTLQLVRTRWLEQVEFITEFTDDPELECWPALLNQVFMNLMINGCEAIAERLQQNAPNMPPGKLWIRLKLQKNNIVIEIEDNGSGMDEAIQKRVLEPFYTTKAVGSGTGLGLSIAFGIIQKHGGNLHFTSALGSGSHFVINLPFIE